MIIFIVKGYNCTDSVVYFFVVYRKLSSKDCTLYLPSKILQRRMFLEILRPDADFNSSPILFSWMCHNQSLSTRCYPSGISCSTFPSFFPNNLLLYLPFKLFFSVSSLHIVLRLCCIAWLNSLREMRMGYQSCFTFRKYIQV